MSQEGVAMVIRRMHAVKWKGHSFPDLERTIYLGYAWRLLGMQFGSYPLHRCSDVSRIMSLV